MTISKFSTLAATAGLLAVTACTSVDTNTGNPNTRTNEGIGVGAAAGAVLGILNGNNAEERRKGAIIGAVLGGAVGGVAGHSMDQQAADLQASISNDRIQIVNNGDHLVVVMPQDILFAIDSNQINNALRADLAALAGNLGRFPGSTVEVFGHTDNSGSASHNRDLSNRRANAVSAVLISNGISGARIRTIGMGEDQPVASNLTAAGRAQNRRVEIVIRQPTG